MKIKILLSMALLVMLSACGTGADGDVYISGSSGTTAVYWKNGIQTNLNTDSIISSGNSIYVNGTDVYVSGVCYGTSTPCYWTNGARKLLSNDSSSGSAPGISVLNGNVYIGGSRSLSVPYGGDYLSTPKAITWLNDVETILNGTSSTTDSAFVYSLFVTTGANVYAAGTAQGSGGTYYGTYWKDGVATTLAVGSLTSIFVKDSLVYIVGTDAAYSGYAVYYAPGTTTSTKLALPAGAASSDANSIYVDGQDVYIAGSYNMLDKEYSCYWKNGEITTLSDDQLDPVSSVANAITVKNGNVYVAGNYYNSDYKSFACYWKNGVKTDLTFGETDRAYAYSIFIQ
jgi:hypothetical protein